MQTLETLKEVIDVLSQGYEVRATPKHIDDEDNKFEIPYNDKQLILNTDIYNYEVDLPSTMEKLYLFVREKGLEYHWKANSNRVDVVIPFSLLQEFYNVFRGSKFMLEQVMHCVLRDEYLVFSFDTYVEQYDKLKLDEIFPDTEYDLERY